MINRIIISHLLACVLFSPLTAIAALDIQEESTLETDNFLLGKSFVDKSGDVRYITADDYVERVEGKPALIIWCSIETPNGLCGIVDLANQKLVLDAVYEDIVAIEYKDTVNYLVKDTGSKIGIVGSDFQIKVPVKYRYMLHNVIYPHSVIGRNYVFGCSTAECERYIYDSSIDKEEDTTYYPMEREEPYLLVTEAGKFGLLRFDNTVKQPMIFDRINTDYPSLNKRILFEMTNNSGDKKYGYFDEILDTAIPAEYDDAYRFSFGVANVRKGNKFGFINADNDTVLPFNYDQADGMLWHTGFDEPTAKVSHQGISRLVGLSGQYYDYDELQPLTYYHGRALINNGKGKYSFVKGTGKLVVPFKYEKAENFTVYYDSEAKEVISAKVVENGKKFFIDKAGEVIDDTLYRSKNRPVLDGQAIYERVCYTCHQAGLLGSPRLGDAEAWKDRVKKGKAVLYEHAINGYNAMPAKGGADIRDTEVKNAVDYMMSKVQ